MWMQLHPDQRQALESPVTIVKRIEQAAQYPVSCGLLFFTLHQIVFDLLDQLRILKIRRKSKVPLEAVPYSEEYKDHLSKSADFLKEVKQFSALRLVLILIFSFIIMCSLFLCCISLFLHQAADKTDNPSLAKFLRARAQVPFPL